MTPEQMSNNLQCIITECLHAPIGDPDPEQYRAAAIAFLILETLDIVRHQNDWQEIEEELSGANPYGVDYLSTCISYGGHPFYNPRLG